MKISCSVIFKIGAYETTVLIRIRGEEQNIITGPSGSIVTSQYLVGMERCPAKYFHNFLTT